MDNVTITFNTILQLFGAIAVVGGGVKIIISMFNPFKELKAEVERLKGKASGIDGRLKDGDNKMHELDAKIDRLDEGMSIIGLAMCEMINHTVTGNDVDELKEQQKKLNEFFYIGKE